MKTIDCAVIGGGPAGMAAAVQLKKSGIDNIMLFERNPYLGGILVQCIHPGFGLVEFKEDLTGPEFAMRYIEQIKELNIPYRLKSMVTDISKDEITVTSKDYGLEKIRVKSIIFAVGCRERTRENLEISGSRPAGIFGAGLAQTLINIHNLKIGNRVVIQGSGDIGLIMARRLIIEGYEVVGVFERLPYLSGLIRNKVQCLDHFNTPLYLNSEISKIIGRDRVEGVYVKDLNKPDSPDSFLDCDTVLFSVGLIPELELPEKADISISNHFNPDVNSKFEGSVEGLFFCGNCLHINDLADTAAAEGKKTAGAVVEYLMNKEQYRKNTNERVPYKEPPKNIAFNEDFFNKLTASGEKVCIVCPMSCRLSYGNFKCPRGEHYFRISMSSPQQRMATMSPEPDKNPIVSINEIPVSNFRSVKKLISMGRVDLNDNTLSVQHNGNKYHFRKTEIL